MYVKVVEKQIQLLTFTISKVSVTQSVNHPKKCFLIFFNCRSIRIDLMGYTPRILYLS